MIRVKVCGLHLRREEFEYTEWKLGAKQDDYTGEVRYLFKNKDEARQFVKEWISSEYMTAEEAAYVWYCVEFVEDEE